MTNQAPPTQCPYCPLEVIEHPDGTRIEVRTGLQHFCVGPTGAIAQPAAASPSIPRLIRASDVQPEPIEWLWRGWLARGELHLLDGDMEQGKTTLVMDLIARLTRGGDWPDAEPVERAGTAVIMTAEDDHARVLRPKLDVMGAKPERVFFFPLLGEEQRERLANIVNDIAEIERLCGEERVDLLFIDPLFSYIGGDMQTGVDNQVRAALAPLSQMARRLNMAVLATCHTTKQRHPNPKHAGGGSVGFSALVRINWLVGPDPLDTAPERRVLAMNKINL